MSIKLKQLFIVGALLLVGSAQAAIVDGVRQAPAMPAPIEAFTDGTTSMYMYNVGAGKFFCGGNDWGTQTSVGETGYRVYFEKYVPEGAEVWDGTTVLFKDSCLARYGSIMNVFFDNADGICYVDWSSQANRYWKLQKNTDNAYYRLSMAECNQDYQAWQADAHPNTFWGWVDNIAGEAGSGGGQGKSDTTRVYSFLDPTVPNSHVDWAFCTIPAYDAYQVEYKIYTVAQKLKKQIDLAKEKGLDVAVQEAVYADETASTATLEEAIAAVKSVIAEYKEANVDYSNPVDKTSFIVNPNMDDTSGWMTIDGVQVRALHTNVTTGVYTSETLPAYEHWNNGAYTGKFYQTVTALPNGVYSLTAAVMGDQNPAAEGSGLYLYANDCKTAVTSNIPAYYTVFTEVSDGSIEIGWKAEIKHSQWISSDSYSLVYYGSKAEAYQVWADDVVANAPKYDDASVASKGMVEEYNSSLVGLEASSKEEVMAVVAIVDAAATAVRENIEVWAQYNALIAEANGLAADSDIDQDSDYTIELVAYVKNEAEGIASAKELTTAELLNEVEKLAKLVDDCKKKALLDNADVTAMYLVNADYSNGVTGWSGTWGAVSNGCMEAYAMDWDAYQIAKGAPQGVYEVSLQGFYRVKRGNDAYTLYQNGQQICPGHVYINNNATPVKCVFDEPVLKSESIYSGTDIDSESDASAFENAIVYGEPYAHIQMGDSVLFPNTMATAGEAFAAGMFKSTANGVVAKDGQELRLGVKGKYQDETWVIWDNFKMIFRGKQIKYVLPHLEEAIAHAAENLEKNMDNTTKEAVAAAKAAAEGVLTSTDEDVVFQALVDLYNLNDSVNASVELYATLLESAEALFEDIAMSPASEVVKNEAATFIETIQIGVGEGTIGKAEAESLLTQTKLWSIKLRMPDVTGASDANAIDVTNVLLNPDFGDNAGVNTTEGWDNATGSVGNDDTQKGALAYEYWQTTFDMSQTIIGGLPNGTYRVEVTAFSRIGSGDEDYAAFVNAPDTLPASRALLYAWSTTDSLNTYREAPVQLWGAGACPENLSDGSNTVVAAPGNTLYVPGSVVSSSVWFAASEAYKNTLHVNVTDGTLTIGMKKTEAPTSSWVVMDDWKLFYLGGESEGDQDSVVTDKLVISELTVTPGSSDVYSFTVSLQGSDVNYTAYQADLQLPPGLEFAYNNSGKLRVSMVKPSIYPYSVEEEENEEGEMVETKSYTHTLSSNIIESNTLRVAVFSSANEDFTATSGALFKVYVKASPYLKPGDVNIGVKNVKLITKDETKYEPADYVSTSVQAEATSTITLKVLAENQYGTCILPFEYTLPTDGSLEAYACSTYNSDVLFLDKVEKMEAYTPYILRSTTGFSSTLSGTVDATQYPEGGIAQSGVLVGTVATKELTEGCYVMQNQGNGTMFYRVGDTPFVLTAGKCYVTLPEGIATTVFSLGGVTGIEEVQATPTTDGQQPIYNLSGQRVNRMTPGQMYIMDGQKVIAK